MSLATRHREIPGTTLFDGAQARKGYALNKMCFSFNDAAARAALPGRVRKVHPNYHIPISNTAPGLLAIETVH